MILLKSNSRFSLPLPAGEPFHYGWSTASTEYSDNTLRYFSRDLMPIAFAIPYHRKIPMDKYLHLSFLLLSTADLVITRYPEILSIDPRISCAYCLAVLCHLNTPKNNFSHLPSIRSSPVVLVFHKSLQNNIRSSENPLEPLALEILACLHYG